MDSPRQKPWLPLAVLAGALAIWTALLAWGAYLQLGANKPQLDVRRPLIVLAAMGVFLSVWGLALWRRSHRK
jgi:hypothetical protein